MTVGCSGGKKKDKTTKDEDTTTVSEGDKGSSGGSTGGGEAGEIAISGYTGTLEGRVTMNLPPEQGKPTFVAPNKDQAACPQQIPQAGWYTQDSSDKKGVCFAVVFLRPKGDGAWPAIDDGVKKLLGGVAGKPGKEVVDVFQPHCQFEPRVSIVLPGQMLRGHNNSDPKISHDFTLKDSKGNPAGGGTVSPGGQMDLRPKANDRAPYSVACNQHTSFMNGYVWSFSHPFAAVTDKDGKFVINNVPTLTKGALELVVWHEMLPEESKRLKVIDYKAGDKTVNIQLP
jgi:hypothetical protein